VGKKAGGPGGFAIGCRHSRQRVEAEVSEAGRFRAKMDLVDDCDLSFACTTREGAEGLANGLGDDWASARKRFPVPTRSSVVNSLAASGRASLKVKAAPAAPIRHQLKRSVDPGPFARSLRRRTSGKPRKYVDLEADRSRRQEAAEKLLCTAASLCEITSHDDEAIFIRRVVDFDADGVLAKDRILRGFKDWLQKRSVPWTEITETTTAKFIFDSKADSTPWNRFQSLMWLANRTPLKIPINQRDRPRLGRELGRISGDGQVLSLDVRGLEILARAAADSQPADSEFPSHMTAHVCTYGCLRPKHASRFIPTHLTALSVQGVVTLGKNKPGYRAAVPRFDVTMMDTGAKLWYAMQGAAEARSGAVEGTNAQLGEKSGSLTNKDMTHDLRYALVCGGMVNPEEFSIRGTRTVLPTTVAAGGEQRERILLALGDWQKSDMPATYDRQRTFTSAYAKLAVVAFLQMGAVQQVQSHADLRAFMANHSADDTISFMKKLHAHDMVVDEVPPELLPKWVKPQRRFQYKGEALPGADELFRCAAALQSILFDFVGADEEQRKKMLEEPRLFDSCVAFNPLILLSDDEAARTSAGTDTESREEDPETPVSPGMRAPMYDYAEPEEEVAEAEVELGSSEGLEQSADVKQSLELPFLTVPEVPGRAPEGMRLWQATANYVHFLRTVDVGTEWAEVPACRRRKAKRATALVEILALGNAEQWSVVQELGIPVCPGCQRVLP
jgi:hypothetical protein